MSMVLHISDLSINDATDCSDIDFPHGGNYLLPDWATKSKDRIRLACNKGKYIYTNLTVLLYFFICPLYVLD